MVPSMADRPRSDNVEDDRILTLGLFLEAHAELITVLDRDLQEACGLTLRWFEVLIRLARSPGGSLTATELAKAIALSSGGTTHLVDRLEREGLVERRSDERDRRVVRVGLTDGGLDILASAVPRHLDSIDRHLLAPLGPERLRALGETSRVLRDALAPHRQDRTSNADPAGRNPGSRA